MAGADLAVWGCGSCLAFRNNTVGDEVNNIQTKRITDFITIETVYNKYMKKDFPSDELIPLEIIHKLWEYHRYDCFGLYQDEKLIGYALFVKSTVNGQYCYLFDYLAVLPEYRNRGYGAVFLKHLSNMITDAYCIVGEVEDPDKADSEDSRQLQQRRLGFYLRNGYLDTKITVCLMGVDYRILEIPCGEQHAIEEIRKIYEAIYRSMLPEKVFREVFRWTSHIEADL